MSMFPMTFQALFRRFHYKIFKYLPLFSKKPWEIIGVKEGKISRGRMKFARLLGILPDYPKKNSVETLRSPGGGPLHSRLVHSFNQSFIQTHLKPVYTVQPLLSTKRAIRRE
jgi:hypothetical protein